jgi:hypothetical protein
MDHPPFLTACLQTGDAPAIHPAQPLVPWWSFTKTALAAGALRLVAERRLSLDDRRPAPSPCSRKATMKASSSTRRHGSRVSTGDRR